VAEKTAAIEVMRIEAENFRSNSDKIAKEINDDYQAVLVKVKEQDLALNNAKKRFRPATCGAPALRLPTQHSLGQTHSSSIPDGTGSELVVTREFIDNCALDAGRLNAWGSWAVKNELPISKE
jgi:hypothetical protein